MGCSVTNPGKYLNMFANRLVNPGSWDTDLLRLTLAGISMTHGCWRMWTHEVSALSGVIAEQGIGFSDAIAWAITINESVGALLLALRLMVWPVGAGMICVYATGIMLFNIHRGFFVVGAGDAGWEYNALLIMCTIVILWRNRHHKLI